MLHSLMLRKNENGRVLTNKTHTPLLPSLIARANAREGTYEAKIITPAQNRSVISPLPARPTALSGWCSKGVVRWGRGDLP
ncbi:MAG: hypothetical protein AABZ02_01420, partial [Bacteroidota bacterium]